MRFTLKGRLILVVVLLLLVGGGGLYFYSQMTGLTLGQIWQRMTAQESAQTPGDTSILRDSEIRSQFLEALFNQVELRRQNITFTVKDGVLTLSGEVESAAHKLELDRLTEQITGLKQVINQVTVKVATAGGMADGAASDPDEQLAKQLEFALYQTDAFDLKGMKVTARGGRVRLSGNVRSLAEKLLAEQIIREMPGVTEVINELAIQPSN